MNTENLKTFIALSKYKNFTKTAEVLFVAQSTVTNRIAELEKELGKRLFDRERKNVCLTNEGTHFLDYAKRIVELESLAVDEINSGDRYISKINLGSTNTIYDCHLKSRLKDFALSNPDTALRITIAHSNSLIEMMNDGVLDLAFAFIDYNKKDIQCVPFCNDEMILVTDAENTEFADGIKLQNLSDINYLYCNFTFQGIGEYIRELFPKHHRFPLEIDRSANIIPYLYKTDSYSFLPKELVKDEIENGTLVEVPLLDFEIPQVRSFVIYGKKSKSIVERICKLT
ncbi:MAG: LysR family transcriptional regulator [Acutalibacteraceae bacterium]